MRDVKRVGGLTMKTMIAAISAGILGLMTMTSAQADTVVSVTQISYDYRNNPICTAVRMNPSTFAALPTDPCTPSTAVGTSGPDRITQNVYDNASQLLATYEGVGTSDIRQYAYYNYTPNGQKAFEIDANHNKTTFTYDGFDRLSKVQYPNTTAGNEISSTTDYETFGYDANSNRTSYRRRNAQTVLYIYDNRNREIFKDLPAYAGSTATSKDIYTGYDAQGHILYKRFASASGSGVSYAYDGLGRVSSTTDINGRTLLFNYLTNSQRNSMTFPDGQGQYYYYTNTGALNWTGIAGGSVAYVPTHDSLGRVVAVGRPNSTGTSYSYDGLSRLASMTNNFAGTANDITWSFNARNAAGQITNWNASTAVYDYVEAATVTDNRTYDGLNRDASIAAVTGGYDAAGNMANDGVRTFTYDVENRLITGNSALTALALNYDPEGRLYSYSYNGSTTSFLYDGANLIGEYDGTGAMTRRYMHTLGTDQPWVQFTGSAVTAANATYLYSNYQGSIIATADLNGNVTELFKYGPYGEPRNSANAESWTGNRFRYTGQTVIPEARLYYYKARVYDPILGRFLQTDPVGSDDDLDLYAYVGGDPINKSDSTGMIACSIGCSSDPVAYLEAAYTASTGQVNRGMKSVGPIDLTQHEGRSAGSGFAGSGHAIRDHVAKSDQYLRTTVESKTLRWGQLTWGEKAEGSFTSLGSANALTASTLSSNPIALADVVAGRLKSWAFTKYFPTPTGKEAFRVNQRQAPIIRPTYGVTTVIQYAPNMPGGILVLTSYPRNPDD